MSLATRCAACGTVFRVVQDQLKVSEGWVRCGRCGDVFNALEGLFDLDRETAPAWTPSQRGALDLLPATSEEHQARAGASAVESPVGEPGARPGVELADTEIDTRADSQIEARLLEREGFDDDDRVGRGEESALDNDGAHSEPTADSEAAAPAPSFLLQADRAARWQHPQVRLGLILAAAVLGLLLVAQGAYWQRDPLAARWPAAAPLLTALCSPLACRVEPPRHLDGLVVESSGLTQLGDAALYQLRVSLRSRDTLPVMTPALDVTLTDSRGEVVARKVLSARDFGAALSPELKPGAELILQAVLDSGDRRISGYSVEVFYP